MISVSDRQVFSLTNRFFSYVFAPTPEGVLEHIYYGAPVADASSLPRYERVERGTAVDFEGHEFFNLNEMRQEFPTSGRGDFRAPAFHGQAADGSSVFTFRYLGHRIVTEKPKLDGMPSARSGGSGRDSETLIVTLEDDVAKMRAELSYTIYADYGVLAKSVRLTNIGADVINLEHVHSTALELPKGAYDILHLHGAWIKEFNAERLPLGSARFVIDSARGTSSAAHNPFVAIMERGADEVQGNVYATTLVCSGNFSMSAETGEFGEVRHLAGINPFNFAWELGAGESFQTPEALHVFTPNGLSAMSHICHDFIRDKITPERFRGVPRPTYLNTWEAAYFDITEDIVLGMAEKAKDIGAEMLVVDDGWFKGRNDPKSSLGDWTADARKFPSGMAALAAKVKAKGLKFGLWFEPEMVSPDSDLYRAHPDWALQISGRTPSLGRHQLTLDLSRPDVRDYIFGALDAHLSCGDIDYVKWDMNRSMSEVGSAALPPHRQRELPHRYMLGLYELLDRVMTAYPNVLFETCASGGNRFDLGMLSYMPQGWISDMCDPSGRLPIITGASYLYPLDVMAAYIGPSPNHQNGKVSNIDARFLAGFFCAARGVSLNAADIMTSQTEIADYMQTVKETRDILRGGYFDRLLHSQDKTVWQYRSRDGAEVYVAHFWEPSAGAPRQNITLRGLNPNSLYHDNDGEFSGRDLMETGIKLPVSKSDAPDELQAVLLHLKRSNS